MRWVAARAVTIIPLVVAPLYFYVTVLAVYGDAFGFDLRYAYLPASEDVLAGNSPYPRLSDSELSHFHAYVYPPLLAFVVAPFLLVGHLAASIIGALLFAGMIAGAIWLCGVRDWRCYGVVFLWAPTFNGIQNLNVSVPLAFGLACLWHFRKHAARFAAVLGILVATKLFLWPLVIWPLAARRLRTAALSIAATGVFVLAPWAAIGFAGLPDHLALLRRLAELEQWDSYSTVAFVGMLGLGTTAAYATAYAGCGLLVVACVLRARQGDDRRAFTLAIAAALVVTPILWQHYLMLLLVPLAVSKPRLSPMWFLPALLWISPLNNREAEWWLRPPVPLVAAALVATCLLAGADLESVRRRLSGRRSIPVSPSEASG